MNNPDAARDILGTYADSIPEDLLVAISERRCLALVGSGISRRCLSKSRKPLPAWEELLRSLASWLTAQQLLGEGEAKEIHELIERGELTMVGQELRDRAEESQLRRFVTEVFDPDAIVPARVHDLLSVIPFRGYLTTNYDNLLERAYVRVWNRQIERGLAVDPDQASRIVKREPFLLKLHGDIDAPSSLVLGERDYHRLMGDSQYRQLLEHLASSYAILMVGYGLRDSDVNAALGRTSLHASAPPRFLLCRRGQKNHIERKRLLHDRGVRVVEYVDYFGFHNHVDTFLEALAAGLGLAKDLGRTRPPVRRRIHVHYPDNRSEDGVFVWNYIFREGAITWNTEAQQRQMQNLEESLRDRFRATDYVVFVCDDESFVGGFSESMERSLVIGAEVGFQVIFLVVGARRRPDFLAKRASLSPVFYLNPKFSEKDLEGFRAYLAQDSIGGYRQQ